MQQTCVRLQVRRCSLLVWSVKENIVHKTMKSLALLSLAFFIACSKSDEPNLNSNNNLQGYDLVKSDSIGIELGDSNYVFGAILDAVYLSDGRIALLDVIQRKILVFSSTGEFICSAGREGMGPGEFISPFSMTALSNGGFAVSDVQQGKVVFFNSGLSNKCVEAGLEDVLLYVGGNIVVGKQEWKDVKYRFSAMGFDRIYPPGTTVERALEALRADLYKEHKAAV